MVFSMFRANASFSNWYFLIRSLILLNSISWWLFSNPFVLLSVSNLKILFSFSLSSSSAYLILSIVSLTSLFNFASSELREGTKGINILGSVDPDFDLVFSWRWHSEISPLSIFLRISFCFDWFLRASSWTRWFHWKAFGESHWTLRSIRYLWGD